MKLTVAALRARAGRPDAALRGYLLFGPEPSETDALRAAVCAGLVAAGGPGTGVTRIDPGAVRRDAATLGDALRAGGLFGGRPVVLVEGAGDGLAPALAQALDGLRPDDGVLVATAGALTARSALRKVFESGANLAACPVYATPMSRPEIAAALRDGGVAADDDGMTALESMARLLDPAAMRSLLTNLILYVGDAGQLAGEADVLACAPAMPEGDADAVIDCTASRQTADAIAATARAYARGVTPGAIAMGLGRHFRQIHALVTARGGAEAAIGRLRPPVFGARRDAMLRDARTWSPEMLESALCAVMDAELALRSSGGPPDRASVERLIVRATLLRGR